MKPEKKPKEEAVRYFPDPAKGLTSKQVAQRCADGFVNIDSTIPTKSIGRILRENVLTLFNILNFVLATAVILVGSYKNLLFMMVVLTNLVIGTVQEIRAKRTVDRLSLLSSAKARVLRDAAEQAIAIEEVVLDDILLYGQGNQIVTDSIVLEGQCEVNESLVTGESDAIVKKPGDMLLSGSFVVSGRCKARAEHVAEDNYVSQIAMGAKVLKKVKSEIMSSLNDIIRVVSILIIPFGMMLFFRQQAIAANTLQDAVVGTVGALIGMIPEGLVLLTSTVLAISVIRLSRYKVLVQELYCIETLARVDTLCLDKTGTITEGTMEVCGIAPLSGMDEEAMREALALLAGSLEDSNPTFLALHERFSREGMQEAQCVHPFSSERKWSGASFSGKGSFVIGAAEFMFRERSCELEQALATHESNARVLLLARSERAFPEKGLPEELKPMGLVMLHDTIRPQACETISYFTEQGVDLKVISGDNVRTVSRIAQRAGLPGYEKAVDATTLQTPEQIEQAATEFAVFGRVTPMQKKQLVCALQKKGRTVAMTGDGVNDVLALKEADCSIAMASGSEAARNISQLVLLESNFDAMPRVVAEGRRTINNIQRSATLFLVKTIYSFLLSFLFIIIPLPYPFMPIQLTLISVFTIGIPSFVLALEPNRERVRGHFLTNVISRAVPGAFTIVINILGVMLLGHFLGFSPEINSTLCVILSGYTGFLLLARLCEPFNKLRLALLIVTSAGFALCLLFMKELFSLYTIGWQVALMLFGLLVAAALLYSGLTRLMKRWIVKREEKEGHDGKQKGLFRRRPH